MYDDFFTQVQSDEAPEFYSFETLSKAELEELHAWYDEIESSNESLAERGIEVGVLDDCPF